MWKKLLFAGFLLIGTFWVTADALFGLLPAGTRDVTVPDFCGRDFAAVESTGDFAFTVEYRYDENIPAGIILRQEPEPGNVRRVNRKHPECEVRLWVSLGRE